MHRVFQAAPTERLWKWSQKARRSYLVLCYLLFAEETGGPPCNVFGVGGQCRTVRVSRAMTFSASLGAGAHNGSVEFVEWRDQPNIAVLAGWIPHKEAPIQHFFHFSFFHFAPTSLSAH